MKLRPIISTCNSPHDKLFWIICTILKPLLQEIPTHLIKFETLLEELNMIPKENLKNFTVFSADIEALYTNIYVPTAINDILEFAEQHFDKLETFGLKLVDIHQLLEQTLGNSYFTYNQKLYIQILGLAMGGRPSPIIATIRIYKLERASLFMDLRLHIYYKRYMDDVLPITRTSEDTTKILKSIEDADCDHKIKLIIDPPNAEGYTPFLNTEIKIDEDGKFNIRWYRKPQKKPIILHKNSHHTESTKTELIKNVFNTVETISSSAENLAYGNQKAIDLIKSNGYTDEHIPNRKRRSRKKSSKKNISKNYTTLQLPFINESVTHKIKSEINKSGLPLKLISTPGTSLRKLLTNSRPLDKPLCPRSNCYTCKNSSKTGTCMTSNTIYSITCNNCPKNSEGTHPQYIGETGRSLHERFGEHFKNARNPCCKSYDNKSMAKHFRNNHLGETPNLHLDILCKNNKTLSRKINEALLQQQLKPVLNGKEELLHSKQFLI